MSDNATNPTNYNAQVGLGCGTLIIIALIVVFLGRADLKPLEAEVAGLRTEVQALRTDIDALRRDLAPERIAPDTNSNAGP